MSPALEQALKARLLWMQVRSCGGLGLHRRARSYAHEAYVLVEQLAVNQAHEGRPYGPACPLLLRDVPRLADLYRQSWRDETQWIEHERKETADHLRWQQAQAHAVSCIERNDWEALDLPSPEHLSAELYAGRLMRVDGHTLDYEEGIVWMDNPYGVPGCLGEEPTVTLCRQFLIRIAKGGMYGPEP